MRNRRVRGLTFVFTNQQRRGRLRLDGVLGTAHRKAGPPLADVERAASHAFDSARLEGAVIGADVLRSVFDEALKPLPERIVGKAVQREK
jgi:hypothetical protein